MSRNFNSFRYPTQDQFRVRSNDTFDISFPCALCEDLLYPLWLKYLPQGTQRTHKVHKENIRFMPLHGIYFYTENCDKLSCIFGENVAFSSHFQYNNGGQSAANASGQDAGLNRRSRGVTTLPMKLTPALLPRRRTGNFGT